MPRRVRAPPPQPDAAPARASTLSSRSGRSSGRRPPALRHPAAGASRKSRAISSPKSPRRSTRCRIRLRRAHADGPRRSRRPCGFTTAARLVKTHPRQPPGGRSIDPHDYPAERSVYALRDVHALQRQAASARRGRSAASPPPSSTAPCRGRGCARLCAARSHAEIRRARASTTPAPSRSLPRCSTSTASSACSSSVSRAAGARRPRGSFPLARFLRPASQYALPLDVRAVSEGDPDDH